MFRAYGMENGRRASIPTSPRGRPHVVQSSVTQQKQGEPGSHIGTHGQYVIERLV